MDQAVAAIFWGIITFSILVLLHEGGHFIAAKAFGVKVHEFMLGLPGPALRFQGKETAYGVTAIPLGGYVRIAGMEPGPEDERLADALAFITLAREVSVADVSKALDCSLEEADALVVTLVDWGAIEPVEGGGDRLRALQPADAAEDPTALLAQARSRTYRGLPTWKRIAVLVAGVLVNLVAAILVFTVVLSIWGYPRASLTLEGVGKGSGAQRAGIQAGDRVIALDGARLATWDDLTLRVSQRRPGTSVEVTFSRDGRERTVSAVLGKGEEGKAVLGVSSALEHVKPNVWEALVQSFEYLKLTFLAVAGFLNPETFRQSVSMSRSVIGVSVEVARIVSFGPLVYAQLVAALSLGLGALNILPIPPLDGGKIAIELIERGLGRPLPRRVYLGFSAAGTLLLFALIGYLMYADVMRYVVRGG